MIYTISQTADIRTTTTRTFSKKFPVEYTRLSTKHAYDTFIKRLRVQGNISRLKAIATPLFAKEINHEDLHSPLIEKTVWGCVSIQKVDVSKDFVQKLLVIRRDGVLGFEVHKRKLEKLKILEGYCVALSVDHKKSTTTIGVKLAGPGDRFVFNPGDEHGILALTNCVIEETSTNHLDDLTYVFKASQL